MLPKDKIGLLMLPDSLLFRVNFFWDQLFGRASSRKQGISGRVHTQKISPEKCHHTHKSRTAQQVLVVERPSRAPSNPRATAVPSGPFICDVRWSDAPKRGARRHTTPRPWPALLVRAESAADQHTSVHNAIHNSLHRAFPTLKPSRVTPSSTALTRMGVG